MRRLLLLVSVAVLVDTTFYAAIAPLLPTYRDDLGLSKAAAGVLSASYAGGTLAASLPAGRLAGRVGPKPTMMLGLLLLSVTSVVFGLANGVVLLDATRFVSGIGGACSWAGGLSWLVSMSPRERRGELIGTALGAAIFGVLLGPAVGGAATQTSPELVFSCVAVFGLGLIAWAAATPAGPRESQAGWGELGAALRGRPMRLAVWLFALPAIFAGAFDVLVPLRFDEIGASGLTIGAAFLAAASVEAVLSPLLGRFSDRRGRLLPLRLGLAGAAAAAVVLPLPAAIWLLFCVVVATVAALGCFWAPAAALLSEASESAGLDQGLAFGLMNLAWAGGQVLGGAAGGAVADATADAVPYGMLAVGCAVTLALVRRHERAPVA